MRVVVAVRALHPLGEFLLAGIDKVHHAQHRADVLAHGVEHIVRPDLALAAVVDEDVGARDGHGVERGRLKAVRLAARCEQQRHVRAVPRDGAGKIVVGEERRHDAQPPVVRRSLPYGAAAE